MALPRAAAVAESAGQRNTQLARFSRALEFDGGPYRAFGLHYADSTWNSHPDAHSAARRSSHDLDQCSHGVGCCSSRAVRQVPAMRRWRSIS